MIRIIPISPARPAAPDQTLAVAGTIAAALIAALLALIGGLL